MSEIQDRIEELMLQKSFDALTPAEQEMVLSVMTDSEFDAQRNVLLESALLFRNEGAQLVPDPNVLFSLREAHAAKRNSALVGLWAFLVGFRIPVYQVGIAGVLLFIALWSVRTTEENTPAYLERIVYQPVIDTIQVIKEVMVEVPVERIVTIVEYRDAPIAAAMASFENIENGITPVSSPPNIDAVTRSFGNTTVNNDELEQFRVTGI